MALSGQIVDASGKIQADNVMATSSTSDTTDNDVALSDRITAERDPSRREHHRLMPPSSETTALGISGSLAVNGVAVTIGAGDSLSDIAANINGIEGQTGVSASVAGSAGGYQLVLRAATKGQQHLGRERRPRYVVEKHPADAHLDVGILDRCGDEPYGRYRAGPGTVGDGLGRR